MLCAVHGVYTIPENSEVSKFYYISGRPDYCCYFLLSHLAKCMNIVTYILCHHHGPECVCACV